jgi:hypothetical protein
MGIVYSISMSGGKYKTAMHAHNENNSHLFSHSDNCWLTTICCTILRSETQLLVLIIDFLAVLWGKCTRIFLTFQLSAVQSSVENDMELLCLTGVEDKLQVKKSFIFHISSFLCNSKIMVMTQLHSHRVRLLKCSITTSF